MGSNFGSIQFSKTLGTPNFKYNFSIIEYPVGFENFSFLLFYKVNVSVF